MNLSLIYFAGVRDLLGKEGESLHLEATQPTVQALVEALKAKYPQLVMEGVRVAVNEEFVSLNATLHDGDTVALIPPVAGG